MQAHIFSGREIPLFGRMEENFSTPQSVALLMPAKAQKLSSILRRQSAFDVNRNVQHFRQERAFLYVANPFLVPGRRNVNMVRDNSRSEEHTSELQSLMRISYAVFCLKKKKQ